MLKYQACYCSSFWKKVCPVDHANSARVLLELITTKLLRKREDSVMALTDLMAVLHTLSPSFSSAALCTSLPCDRQRKWIHSSALLIWRQVSVSQTTDGLSVSDLPSMQIKF